MSLTVSSNKLKFRENTSSAWQGLLLQGEVNILDLVYPVGSIYLSVSGTNPGTLFGGTWERIKDRFLLAAGDSYAAGATGGEAAHTLSVAEMPAHYHIPTSSERWQTLGFASGGWTTPVWNDNGNPTTAATSTTGGSQPHNNMPPYLAVYVWKRTA